MKTIPRLLSFLQPFFREICLSILFGVAAIGAGIGLLGTSAYLIASAALHPSIAELQIAIVGVRFFGISRAAFRYFERLVSHSVNLKVLSRLRVWFYRQVESSPPGDLYTYKSGDLLTRVMGDLETLENFYVRVVSPVVIALVVGTGVSLFIGAYDKRLGLVLALGLILNGYILPGLSLWITRIPARKTVETRAALSVQVVELLQGLEDLLTSGATDRWLERLDQKGSEAGRLQERTALLNGINSGLNLLLLNLTMLVLLWIAIPLVTQGLINGVSLAVILLIGMAGFECVANLPQAAEMLNASLLSAGRLFEIIPTGQPLPPVNLQPDHWRPSTICAESLSFDYDGDFTFQLHDISFEMEKGRKLALIGPSGAGKTSLVNLLLSFWKPTQGSIRFDQLDSGCLDPYLIRTCFAVISQNTWIFSSSLRENLLLADPQADDRKLLQILKAVELENWLKQLPEGLDTWLGDQGLRLSGGERQRVAIARALLQDRPFVILDEPVENLDPATAKNVLDALFDLFHERGILWITHDLSHLHLADEILLLENGAIVEHGGYASLKNKGGRFATLVNLDENSL